MVIGSLLDCLMRVTDSLWNLGAVKLNTCEYWGKRRRCIKHESGGVKLRV